MQQHFLNLPGSFMYTREETARQKQAFWTAFGKYMQPVLSADGERRNWINYKTGIAGIYFRMDADTEGASIAIVLSQGDAGLRQQYYERFMQLRMVLQNVLGEEWDWQPSVGDEYGKTVASIGKEMQGVNINRSEDWPQIISFLKPRIIALDAFWSMVKDGFEGMGSW